jgi:steroid 5-alpha reductase family enzyme
VETIRDDASSLGRTTRASFSIPVSENNKGELLDTGFWAIYRHADYFREILIYFSYTLVGGSIWAWTAPLLDLIAVRRRLAARKRCGPHG